MSPPMLMVLPDFFRRRILFLPRLSAPHAKFLASCRSFSVCVRHMVYLPALLITLLILYLVPFTVIPTVTSELFIFFLTLIFIILYIFLRFLLGYIESLDPMHGTFAFRKGSFLCGDWEVRDQYPYDPSNALTSIRKNFLLPAEMKIYRLQHLPQASARSAAGLQ